MEVYVREDLRFESRVYGPLVFLLLRRKMGIKWFDSGRAINFSHKYKNSNRMWSQNDGNQQYIAGMKLRSRQKTGIF